MLDQNPREISTNPSLVCDRNFPILNGRILFHLSVLMHKSSYTWKKSKKVASPLVILAMKGNGKVSMLLVSTTLYEFYINGSGGRDCVMNEYT